MDNGHNDEYAEYDPVLRIRLMNVDKRHDDRARAINRRFWYWVAMVIVAGGAGIGAIVTWLVWLYTKEPALGWAAVYLTLAAAAALIALLCEVRA